MNDPIILILLKLFGIQNTAKNYGLLFDMIYSFIPAFVFAPYLLYVGLKFSLNFLIFIALTIFFVDVMHLFMSFKKKI
tara:strand:- start:4424 stop:4657 length:234 start_codon:yes stop_codon:yes gene_type:complete